MRFLNYFKLMEYETPLDQLRPVSASNKKMDSSAMLDYNEIISGIGGQGPVPQQMEETHQHMQPPPPQYSQMPPQIAHEYDEPALRQAMMAQQIQNAAQQSPKEKSESEQESFVSDNDQRDFLYIIIAIALIFSEGSQQYLSTMIPSLFRDGKSSLVGLMFNALLLIIGLIIVRKVKVSI